MFGVLETVHYVSCSVVKLDGHQYFKEKSTRFKKNQHVCNCAAICKLWNT